MRRRGAGLRKLGSMLPDAIDRREVLRAARAQRVLQRWPEIVGEMLASRSQPDKVDRGTLWVSVQGSAWAQELRMLETQILAKITAISGDDTLITELRFGVRPPREKPAGLEPRPRIVPDPELEHMSIKDIKERRLKKWEQENG